MNGFVHTDWVGAEVCSWCQILAASDVHSPSEAVRLLAREIHGCFTRCNPTTLVLAKLIRAAMSALPFDKWTYLRISASRPFSRKKAEMLVVGGRDLGEMRSQKFARLPAGWSSVLVVADYNGYTTNTLQLGGGGAHDVLLATNNLHFQTGVLGRCYLPTSGPATNLFNAGSTNTDLLGLYHYTTTTDQAKETNSVVDIGQPVDSDGDGIADWMEDIFGNAIVNSGETVWTNATDLGLKVQITNPRSNSPLP